MGRKRSKLTSVESMERDARAVHLRRIGLTYREIGTQLDVAPSTAREMVRRALRESMSDDIEEVRRIELARLEGYQRRVEQILEEVHPVVSQGRVVLDANGRAVPDRHLWLQALDRGVRLSKRRSELLGLDLPAHGTPDVGIDPNIDDEIGRLLADLGELGRCPTCDPAELRAALPPGEDRNIIDIFEEEP